MAGYGWGNHVPETAKIVAKAFHAGRECKRGNCSTDGEFYWLKGCAIARRVREQDFADNLTAALLGQRHRPSLEFNIQGWATQMTARHLVALGVKAECRGIKNPIFTLMGRRIKTSTWYSIRQIEDLPLYEPPVARRPALKPGYIELNLSLF